MTLDANILLYVQENIRNLFLSGILVPYTHFGDYGIMWIVMAIVLVAIPKTRKAGVLGFIALGLAWILNDLCLKVIISRARPYDAIPGLVALIGPQMGSSCPSGHSACSFASAFAIFLNTKKRIGIPVLILAVLIGFSRIYVGVHYLSDVLFGFAIGSLVAILTSVCGNKFIKRRNKKIQESR